VDRGSNPYAQVEPKFGAHDRSGKVVNAGARGGTRTLTALRPLDFEDLNRHRTVDHHAGPFRSRIRIQVDLWSRIERRAMVEFTEGSEWFCPSSAQVVRPTSGLSSSSRAAPPWSSGHCIADPQRARKSLSPIVRGSDLGMTWAEARRGRLRRNPLAEG
jgi:hypothetical protein